MHVPSVRRSRAAGGARRRRPSAASLMPAVLLTALVLGVLLWGLPFGDSHAQTEAEQLAQHGPERPELGQR